MIESVLQETTCLNCGETYRLKFCNACGQKTPHRYTVKHVVEEVFHSITHADRGIFALIRDLVLHPGRVALDMVEGKRKRHFNLFQYLIIITGITTFLVAKTNLLEELSHLSTRQSAASSARVIQFQQDVLGFMRQYNNFFQFALLPLTAFCAWLLTRKGRFNYAENVVMMIAATAAVSTVSLVPVLLHILVIPIPAIVYLCITLGVLLYYYSRCYHEFHGFKWPKSILLGVVTYIMFSLMQVLLVSIFVFIYLLLFI